MFSVHTKPGDGFEILGSCLKSVFKNLRFRDVLLWTVGLTRFQIFLQRNYVYAALFIQKEGGQLYKLQLFLKLLFVIKPRGS